MERRLCLHVWAITCLFVAVWIDLSLCYPIVSTGEMYYTNWATRVDPSLLGTPGYYSMFSQDACTNCEKLRPWICENCDGLLLATVSSDSSVLQTNPSWQPLQHGLQLGHTTTKDKPAAVVDGNGDYVVFYLDAVATSNKVYFARGNPSSPSSEIVVGVSCTSQLSAAANGTHVILFCKNDDTMMSYLVDFNVLERAQVVSDVSEVVTNDHVVSALWYVNKWHVFFTSSDNFVNHAASADGLSWKLVVKTALSSNGGPYVLVYLNVFFMFYQDGCPDCIGLLTAYSTDGIQWISDSRLQLGNFKLNGQPQVAVDAAVGSGIVIGIGGNTEKEDKKLLVYAMTFQLNITDVFRPPPLTSCELAEEASVMKLSLRSSSSPLKLCSCPKSQGRRLLVPNPAPCNPDFAARLSVWVIYLMYGIQVTTLSDTVMLTYESIYTDVWSYTGYSNLYSASTDVSPVPSYSSLRRVQYSYRQFGDSSVLSYRPVGFREVDHPPVILARPNEPNAAVEVEMWRVTSDEVRSWFGSMIVSMRVMQALSPSEGQSFVTTCLSGCTLVWQAVYHEEVSGRSAMYMTHLSPIYPAGQPLLSYPAGSITSDLRTIQGSGRATPYVTSYPMFVFGELSSRVMNGNMWSSTYFGYLPSEGAQWFGCTILPPDESAFIHSSSEVRGQVGRWRNSSQRGWLFIILVGPRLANGVSLGTADFIWMVYTHPGDVGRREGGIIGAAMTGMNSRTVWVFLDRRTLE